MYTFVRNNKYEKILIFVSLVLLIAIGAFYFISSGEEKQLENFANSLQENPNASANLISMDEVARHSLATDCWMVIDNDVLDVTSFVDKHPGGSVITDGCGKDATGYFNGVREHMKPIVKTLAQKMIIGKVRE